MAKVCWLGLTMGLILASCGALKSPYAFKDPVVNYERTYWVQEADGSWKEYPPFRRNGKEYISSELAYRKDVDGRLRVYTRDDRPVFYIIEISHDDPEAINWLCHYKYRVKTDQPVLGCAIPFDERKMKMYGERIKGFVLYPHGAEYKWVVEHERAHLLEASIDTP